jgi:hypothetical protein
LPLRLLRRSNDGATLEQVIAAKPTAEWDERYGNPAGILNRAFMSLSR